MRARRDESMTDIVPRTPLRKPRPRFATRQPYLPMRTSYRDIALLACCQALLLVNNAGLISMNGLIGHELAENKALSTFGATTYVLGSALTTMPASLWMGRVGRRRGFMLGSAIGVVGSALAAFALWRG